MLADGQLFRFDLDDTPGDDTRVQLPHREIIDTLGAVSIVGTAAGGVVLCSWCMDASWHLRATFTKGSRWPVR